MEKEKEPLTPVMDESVFPLDVLSVAREVMEISSYISSTLEQQSVVCSTELLLVCSYLFARVIKLAIN